MDANFTVDENDRSFEHLVCSTSLHELNAIRFLAAVNIFLSITVSIGNAVILVALRKESSLQPPSKLLYICLATTDLCVGLILQPIYVIQLISIITGHENLCVHLLTASYVIGVILLGFSLSILAAISVDRLLALLLRLRYRLIVTLKRTRVIVATLWFLQVFVGTMFFWEHFAFLWYGYIHISVCLITSTFSYTKIYFTLRRHTAQILSHVQQSQPSSGSGGEERGMEERGGGGRVFRGGSGVGRGAGGGGEGGGGSVGGGGRGGGGGKGGEEGWEGGRVDAVGGRVERGGDGKEGGGRVGVRGREGEEEREGGRVVGVGSRVGRLKEGWKGRRVVEGGGGVGRGGGCGEEGGGSFGGEGRGEEVREGGRVFGVGSRVGRVGGEWEGRRVVEGGGGAGRGGGGGGTQANVALYRKTVSTAVWIQLTLVACYVPYGIHSAFIAKYGLSPSIVLSGKFVSTLVYVNSFLNPFLYCWKMKGLRQAVKDTIRQFWC